MNITLEDFFNKFKKFLYDNHYYFYDIIQEKKVDVNFGYFDFKKDVKFKSLSTNHDFEIMKKILFICNCIEVLEVKDIDILNDEILKSDGVNLNTFSILEEFFQLDYNIIFKIIDNKINEI